MIAVPCTEAEFDTFKNISVRVMLMMIREAATEGDNIDPDYDTFADALTIVMDRLEIEE